MSRKRPSEVALKPQAHAAVFAALGDATRLALVARLAGGARCSIAELTSGCEVTRQAVTKHLRVLESAGLVHSVRAGRQALFELDPQPIRSLSGYLEAVSAQWDGALARLKTLVERDARSME